MYQKFVFKRVLPALHMGCVPPELSLVVAPGLGAVSRRVMLLNGCEMFLRGLIFCHWGSNGPKAIAHNLVLCFLGSYGAS